MAARGGGHQVFYSPGNRSSDLDAWLAAGLYPFAGFRRFVLLQRFNRIVNQSAAFRCHFIVADQVCGQLLNAVSQINARNQLLAGIDARLYSRLMQGRNLFGFLPDLLLQGCL